LNQDCASERNGNARLGGVLATYWFGLTDYSEDAF
jgi:hypothetical protein